MKSWISKFMIVVGSLLVLLGIVIYIINDIDSKKEELPKYWVQKKIKLLKEIKNFLLESISNMMRRTVELLLI